MSTGREFYFDVVLQVYRDKDGVHYAIGAGFDADNDEEPLAAYGTVDDVGEAIYAVRREVNGLLDNVEL